MCIGVCTDVGRVHESAGKESGGGNYCRRTACRSAICSLLGSRQVRFFVPASLLALDRASGSLNSACLASCYSSQRRRRTSCCASDTIKLLLKWQRAHVISFSWPDAGDATTLSSERRFCQKQGDNIILMITKLGLLFLLSNCNGIANEIGINISVLVT